MEEIVELMSEKRSDVFNVDPRGIEIMENFNGREDYGDITELKAEIKAAGKILNNSYGFRHKGIIKLINGHRRNIAARELIESGEMPELRQPIVLLKGTPTEMEMIKIMVLTNKGKNFTPLEDANTMMRMYNLGASQKEIAIAYGKTDAHVCNSLALAKLPQNLKKLISGNDISSSLVLSVLRENKELSIEQITQKVEEVIAKSKTIGKKVTKAVIDKEMNKINSLAEMKKVMKNAGEAMATNKWLYAFCDALVNNQLTAEDIEEALGLAELETTEA